MNILSKSLQEITFDDVVECCKAGTLESAVLDYKKTMPSDLAKHFATFSNTHGGMIIIGVEEDSATGKPKKYEGIVFDGKFIDQVHQFAANVTPFPRYEVRPTNEVNGKVFILIKIFEGDQPPYMSNSDSTIRLRTGNISTPIRDVESKELEKLYEKRHNATQWQDTAISTSDLIHNAALERAVKEWQEKRASDPENVSGHMPNNQAAPFRVTIMPVSPSVPIVDYREIKNRLHDYRIQTRYHGDFPDLSVETMPGGIMFAKWSWIDGGFTYGQITEHGVIDSVIDVMNENTQKQTREIWMAHMAGNLARQLEAAKSFYNMFGFNGLLVCKITLEEAKGSYVYPLLPEGHSYSPFRENPLTKLGSYKWEVANLDTVKLNDIQALANEVVETIERFYWDFGLSRPNKEVINEYFRQQGWKIPKAQNE